jgi:hypothetical protein
MRAIKESALLKTSSAGDLQCSGGVLTITGLKPVSKKDISSIKQIKGRAEVPQVVRVGGTSYTPTASTPYKVAVYDPNRTESGFSESPKVYTYITPADILDIGATAALQREYIHGQLVSKINPDQSNHATAASLGTGTGFTVTDNGGYYPVKSQTMTNVLGANKVFPITNEDGSGFASDNFTVTVSAVYSSGVGAILASMAPVIDAMNGGNLIQGSIDDAPVAADGTYAVSGQLYDAFVITSLKEAAAYNVSGQIAYQPRVQSVWVDNGTGSATTNLAGFLAFERITRKQIAQVYGLDTNTWIDFLDSPTLFQGAAGAVPATTGESKISTDYGQWVYTNIGTNTITVPTPSNTGLLLDQDLANAEGAEHTPSLLTNNSKSFIVGKDECSITVKLTSADHTDASFMAGFRIKAAHAADFNDYTDLGSIGFLGDLVYTWGILNNAATVATNTTIVPTDAAVEEFVVKVDITGLVTVSRNGIVYPVYSVGTTPLAFDAGDTIIPFVRSVNISGGDPDVIVSQLISVADINWLS